MENRWEEFDDRHQKEYRYWIRNIQLGMSKRIKGEWSAAKYHEHMIQIAKEVRIPHQDIVSMEKELEFIKTNGFREYIKIKSESNKEKING